MTRIENFAKWLGIGGLVLWGTYVVILLWQLPNAPSYAESSFVSHRLLVVALAGALCSFALSRWLAPAQEGHAGLDRG